MLNLHGKHITKLETDYPAHFEAVNGLTSDGIRPFA
jgi:hypothetical protein